MAYSEKLAGRIRQRLADIPKVQEVKMMGGLTFMCNGKMCVGVLKDELMCRIDPALHDRETSKPGCRTMDFTKRPMSGFILVEESAMQTSEQFDYWIDLALAFNQLAKASRKGK